MHELSPNSNYNLYDISVTEQLGPSKPENPKQCELKGGHREAFHYKKNSQN